MNDFVRSGLIIGVLAMLFFTPFLMARGVTKLDDRTGAGNTILCLIPFLNLIRAEKIYYGKFRLMLVSTILVIIGVVSRVFIWRNAYNNVTLGTVSIIVFFGTIIFYFVSNMVFVYTVIHDADAMSGFKLILFSIAYPFGQYYIGAYLVNVIRHMQAKEATFRR